MSIDGAWECRAGVLYQVKHSRKFESGVRLVDAEPTPGVGTSIRRLRSVVSLEAMANSPSGAMAPGSPPQKLFSLYFQPFFGPSPFFSGVDSADRMTDDADRVV